MHFQSGFGMRRWNGRSGKIVTELVCFERKSYGFYVVMYESEFGGFAIREMEGYSKTAAIKELRSLGVICPKSVYKEE